MIEITVNHLSGARKGAVETFAVLPVRLGRAAECEVRLDPEQDGKVSGVHAELRFDPESEALEIADLGSKNGVLLNGARVAETAPVPNHGVVELGPGGPRLRITYEVGVGGGVSFSRMRRPTQDPSDIAPVGDRLRSTEESMPALPASEIEGGGGPSQGLLLAAVVGVVLAMGAVVFLAMR